MTVRMHGQCKFAQRRFTVTAKCLHLISLIAMAIANGYCVWPENAEDGHWHQLSIFGAVRMHEQSGFA
ncbi:hypothetical protein Plhal304r1_c029g0094181 [Plasmopara halstedii]